MVATDLITDPLFYAVAIPALIVTGISKAGFGGITMLSVPLMALVISPVQAAGIMLPILIAMDFFSIWVYRKSWDKKNLLILIPGSILGITIGGLTAGSVDDNVVRLIVGLIAVSFVVYRLIIEAKLAKENKKQKPLSAIRPSGLFWGALSGFTSFVAHAGSPPFQVYVLPQRLDKAVFAGTGVMFFAFGNALKLIPYGMLGQLSSANLVASAVLLPLVPVGVLLGFWINRKMTQKMFYQVVLIIIFLVGLKLIWDGLSGTLNQ